MRVVKLSVLLEFHLATEQTDEQLVNELKEHVRTGVRPEWKGFNFSGTLPGTIAGKPKKIDVAIGHDVFVIPPPPPAPRAPRKRKR